MGVGHGEKARWLIIPNYYSTVFYRGHKHGRENPSLVSNFSEPRIIIRQKIGSCQHKMKYPEQWTYTCIACILGKNIECVPKR